MTIENPSMHLDGETGGKCRHTGFYRASCHPHERIHLRRGDTFPPCVQRGPGDPRPEGAEAAHGAFWRWDGAL